MRTIGLIAGGILLFTSIYAGTQQAGYVRLLPEEGITPAAVALIGFRSAGVLVTEASVPAAFLIQSGRIFAEMTSSVKTGIAMANPTGQDLTISYYFTDVAGNTFGEKSLTLPAAHQIASFLDEAPFSLPVSMQGTFTFTSSGPFAAVALRGFTNERGEFLMTTVPVTPLGSGFGGAELIFPSLTNEDGWNVRVVLVNPGDTLLSGAIRFQSRGTKFGVAQPVKMLVNSVSSAVFSYAIPPRGAVQILAESTVDTADVGSMRVVPAPASSLPASLGFVSLRRGIATISTASLAPASYATSFRTYVESSGVVGNINSIETSVTISNPSSVRVSAQLSLKNLDGTAASSPTTVEIDSGSQIVRFARELLPQSTSTFRGVLRVAASSPLGVISARSRYNERGEPLLTITPPWDETVLPLGSEMIFPLILSGDGYSTQLFLITGGSGASGKMWLHAQDGGPLQGVALQAVPGR